MWVTAEDTIKVVGQGYTMIGTEHRNTWTNDRQMIHLERIQQQPGGATEGF